MLAGVDERDLGVAILAQLGEDGGDLDEVRPGADHGRQLHFGSPMARSPVPASTSAAGAKAKSREQPGQPRLRLVHVDEVPEAGQCAHRQPRLAGIQLPWMQVDHGRLSLAR